MESSVWVGRDLHHPAIGRAIFHWIKFTRTSLLFLRNFKTCHVLPTEEQDVLKPWKESQLRRINKDSGSVLLIIFTNATVQSHRSLPPPYKDTGFNKFPVFALGLEGNFLVMHLQQKIHHFSQNVFSEMPHNYYISMREAMGFHSWRALQIW